MSNYDRDQKPQGVLRVNITGGKKTENIKTISDCVQLLFLRNK